MANNSYSLVAHAKRLAQNLPAALEPNPYRFKRSKQFDACQHAAEQLARLYGVFRGNDDIYDITPQVLETLRVFTEHAAIKLCAATDALRYHPHTMSKFPDKASATLARLADALKLGSADEMRDRFAADVQKLHDVVHPPTEQANEPNPLTI